MKPDSFDPEALDQALAKLAESAQEARDCFIMDEDQLGRQAFQEAIHALSNAVHQISLKYIKYRQ